MAGMRLVLNVIWLVFGGFWLFCGYLLAGLLMCITIIGIPFGIAAFRIGLYALWPFGRRVVARPTAGLGSALGNILWFLLAGWWLALGHLVTGIAMCITIIGIPLGLGNFKLIPVSLLPLGQDIVSTSGRDPFTSGAVVARR
jgi:uncharacterized membrane protein YccF (DUF307 family)